MIGYPTRCTLPRKLKTKSFGLLRVLRIDIAHMTSIMTYFVVGLGQTVWHDTVMEYGSK